MSLVAKCFLLLSLALIFYQDLKDRKVWTFLFPVFALCGSYLFFKSVVTEFFITSVFINIAVIGIILLLNYLFARFILKKKFLKEALGLGDILFFIAFAISFPTVTFINFFVFSILFTFVFHIIIKRISPSWQKEAPLAGCMSLFLMAVYSIHWTGFYHPIYIL